MNRQLGTYYNFAILSAWEAGKITLNYFLNDLQPTFKEDGSPVTIADKETERYLCSVIKERFPDHAILGEEYGEYQPAGNDGHRWIIDPIDGTNLFLKGIPLYGVLIALEIFGKCQMGVAHFPALGETIAAARGLGCWWNDSRAHVSNVKNLYHASVSHADAASFAQNGKKEEWERLKQASHWRIGIGGSYGYMLVATGRADITIDPQMKIWDSAPFVPILQEAGGYFGDWKGVPTHLANETLATNKRLLSLIISSIKADPYGTEENRLLGKTILSDKVSLDTVSLN